MKDDIYTLLNHIDNQMDEAEWNHTKFETDEVEVKKWMSSFRKKKGRKKADFKHFGYAVAAFVMITVLGIAVSPYGVVVSAGMKAIVYDISELLGIEKDLTPYSQMVNESISKDGLSVTLNEVICDDETMEISYTTTAPIVMNTPEDEMKYMSDATVFMNGRRVSVAASGFMRKVDDYNLVSSMKLELPDIDLSEEIDMEIQFTGQSGKNIGSFEFCTSGKELMVATETVAINETFVFPDLTTITFTRYTSNVMGQRIYYEISAKENNYDIKLVGRDDLGNDVEFNLRFASEQKGRLEVSTIHNGYVKEAASALTLTPYFMEFPEESGELKGEWAELISEKTSANEIVISLK